MAKSTVKYRVRISFVDNTYWDDGSRWTNKTFKFNKRREATAFAHNAMNNGCEVSGQNGDLIIKPNKDDIVVYRDSVSEIKWENE